MRGRLGTVLIGLGAFLLVAAVVLRAYAYPKLAVAPIDQNSETVLDGPGATVFDIASLSEIQTDLTTTVQTVADVEATEEASGDTRVWVSTSSTKDADGVVRSRSVDRVAFDGHTAEAVNCCGEFYETVEGEQEPIEHEGLLVKFPFGTEQETYPFWDSSLRETVDIDFVDTDEVDGLDVYRFEHVIEPTVVGTIDLPAAVLGEEGDETLTAERMYSNTRTLWVEPVTGVIIDRAEQQLSTLRYDGEDRVTLTEVDTSYSDETVASNIDEYSPKASLLSLVHGTLPWVLGILGLLLLVAGSVLAIRRQRAEEEAPDEDDSLPGGRRAARV
jgi:hypothetical protein